MKVGGQLRVGSTGFPTNLLSFDEPSLLKMGKRGSKLLSSPFPFRVHSMGPALSCSRVERMLQREASPRELHLTIHSWINKLPTSVMTLSICLSSSRCRTNESPIPFPSTKS